MDNRVVIDSDFSNMIAPGKDVAREKDFIKSIFNSLGLRPVVHTFVINQEMLTNQAVKELVKEKFIEVIDYNSFLCKEWYKSQYIDDFKNYYSYMNSEEIPENFDIFTQHIAKKNMGEIHSLILAHYLNIPIFMSNDNGAKNLADSRINSQTFQISVKNVLEVFCEIKERGTIQLDKKAVRSILKERDNLNWLEKYKEFCQLNDKE